MAMFKGFKPQGLQKIANSMGYTGSLEGFDSYLQQNPDKQNMMNMYNQRAMQMAQGGAVRKMAVGGVNQAGQFQSAMPTGNPADMEQFPTAELPPIPNPSGIRPMYEEKNPAKLNAIDKQIAGAGYFAQPAQLQGVKQVFTDQSTGQPMALSALGQGIYAAPRPTSFNYTREQAQARAMQRDIKSPEEQRAIDMALGRGKYERGFDDPVGSDPIIPQPGPQPQPLPQQYIPQIDDQYLGVPEEGADPYADYRQNVETFPGTNTFKNPNIQTSFDAMQEELAKDDTDDPLGTKKSDKILDYVRNMYSGPVRLSEQEGYQGLGGGQFTEEFKNFAREVGLTITDNIAADGPQLVSVQEGSPIATTPGYIPPAPTAGGSVTDITGKLAFNPALPEGATAVPVGVAQSPDQMLQQGTGQVSGTVSVPTAMASTTMAEQPGVTDANLMTPEAVATQVNSSLDSLQAAQTDPNDPRAKVLAAQQTASSVSNLDAAQGNATLMENPVQREIQQGELISGAADAEKASKFTEQIQAATATPSEKATVQGQLAQLTADFDASNPPPWAAGALRGVQAQLQQRGLGASSIAGQALIQGALESALPIAQADAQTQAQFESQNLSNRQQRAMLAAQQRAQFIGQEFDQAFQARVQNSARIGDIANMNFTAEQNIAMENSRAVNTMNLQNLNNSQAMVMAEASALSNLDMANLNNRQQAAVQNAQTFLQRDMANLSNQQQTDLFKAQQRTQALFTDQAATNAARQFNASSQNQVDQFFANLNTQVAQFNATQANAQSQFNAGQANTVERFNAELNNQRDQFNAQNQLVIAQSNAQWRRQIATADTAAINRANELNASALLNISKTAYDNLWQHYGDTMEWAWTSAENELDRIVKITTAEITADAATQGYKLQADAKASTGLGSMIGTILTAGSSSLVGKFFGGICWIAREIYGPSSPKWVLFRTWLDKDAPSWFKWLYGKYGKQIALFIKDKPRVKKIIKYFMDKVVENPRYKNKIREGYNNVPNIQES
jgi:hypothetical protein